MQKLTFGNSLCDVGFIICSSDLSDAENIWHILLYIQELWWIYTTVLLASRLVAMQSSHLAA